MRYLREFKDSEINRWRNIDDFGKTKGKSVDELEDEIEIVGGFPDGFIDGDGDEKPMSKEEVEKLYKAMVDDVEHNKGVDKRNDEEIDDSLEERRIYGFKKFNEMNNFEDFTHVDREDVKDLFDEGLTAEEIAIELDFSLSKVRQIISTLDKSKSFDDGDLEGLDESKKSGVAKSLKKKSNASGIPVGILRKVFSKGMQAWNAGHRPGVAQHQWAFGRVNSFITGSGGARKADADLWTKAKAAKERKKKKK
jgi:hypothetical protein